MVQTFSYVADYSYANKKSQKDILTFLNVPTYCFISHEKKWTCPPNRGRMVALLNNATRMRPVQI